MVSFLFFASVFFFFAFRTTTKKDTDSKIPLVNFATLFLRTRSKDEGDGVYLGEEWRGSRERERERGRPCARSNSKKNKRQSEAARRRTRTRARSLFLSFSCFRFFLHLLPSIMRERKGPNGESGVVGVRSPSQLQARARGQNNKMKKKKSQSVFPVLVLLLFFTFCYCFFEPRFSFFSEQHSVW